MPTTHTNFDASFCGKLPLHQTNMIQPHGVMILLAKDTFKIIQVSENIDALIHTAAHDLMDRELSEYVVAESFENIKEKTGSNFEGKIPITITFNEKGNKLSCLTLIHQKPDYLALEIELPQFIDAVQHSFSLVYQQLKYVMAAIDAAASVEDVCKLAAKHLKTLSGFDKVMLYSFDAEWNGTVIAEALEEGMDQYLGLKFPASDIPKPARDMYFKNPYRLIPNRDYVPVKLYPVLNAVTNAFSDLSDCNLRSVAGVHLEYLKNMNVIASMSTRIIVNEKLWGLISCHHRTAKYLSYEMCTVFELLSTMISAKIGSLQSLDIVKRKTALHQLYRQFIDRVYTDGGLVKAFSGNKPLLADLLTADAVVIQWNGKTLTYGDIPAAYEIESLLYWLQSKGVQQTVHENVLSDVFDEAMNYSAIASGLLALPVQADKGNYIVAFRKEMIQNVSWGGNPDEALTFEKNSTVYHPRNSFTTWQEKVKHTALPWNPQELEVAEQLRNFLVEYTLRSLSN